VTLGRAYLKEIGQHLLLVLGSLLFLVALGAAVQAGSRSQGAPLWVPLTLIPLLVGNTLPYLVPVTLLVAVVLVYGRMAADGEAMALAAAGAGPLRLQGPALCAGLLVAAALYPVSAELLPAVYTRMREVSYRLRFAALENTDPGASELHYQGLHLLWRERGPDGAFMDALLYLADTGGALRAFPGDPGVEGAAAAAAGEAVQGPLRVRASRVRMAVRARKLVFHLEGLRFLDPRTAGTHSLRTTRTASTWFQIDLESLGSRPDSQRKPDDYRSSEIRRLLAEERLGRRRRASFEFLWWRRWSMALAALPLALLGAALGRRLRRGGFLPAFAVSLGVVLLIFFPLFYLGDALQKGGSLAPWSAAGLPVAGLLAFLFLLSRLPRPAA